MKSLLLDVSKCKKKTIYIYIDGAPGVMLHFIQIFFHPSMGFYVTKLSRMDFCWIMNVCWIIVIFSSSLLDALSEIDRKHVAYTETGFPAYIIFHTWKYFRCCKFGVKL